MLHCVVNVGTVFRAHPRSARGVCRKSERNSRHGGCVDGVVAGDFESLGEYSKSMRLIDVAIDAAD